MEDNKEGLFTKKECKEQGPKGCIFKLSARGERQLKERLSDFERKGETIPPNWKMQQTRIIPKTYTYQREQYHASKF